MPGDEWMLIGQVAGPFGVRGELKVDLFTDFPERFNSLETVYLGPAHAETHVERARRHKGQVVLKLEGIDSPEAVRDLGRPEMYVPRSEAADLPPGHFYLDDAIGIEVITDDGETLGTVRDVLRTGSNDVFVVGSGSREVLIPVIRDAIDELDVPAGRVVVQRWALGGEE